MIITLSPATVCAGLSVGRASIRCSAQDDAFQADQKLIEHLPKVAEKHCCHKHKIETGSAQFVTGAWNHLLNNKCDRSVNIRKPFKATNIITEEADTNMYKLYDPLLFIRSVNACAELSLHFCYKFASLDTI